MLAYTSVNPAASTSGRSLLKDRQHRIGFARRVRCRRDAPDTSRPTPRRLHDRRDPPKAEIRTASHRASSSGTRRIAGPSVFDVVRDRSRAPEARRRNATEHASALRSQTHHRLRHHLAHRHRDRSLRWHRRQPRVQLLSRLQLPVIARGRLRRLRLRFRHLAQQAIKLQLLYSSRSRT